jgi:hypothetical protein
MKVTAFKDIYTKRDGYFMSIGKALARIREGKSKDKVEAIRCTLDESLQNEMKKHLPCICFSGLFSERFDNCLVEHSGFICCDVDKVPAEEMDGLRQSLFGLSYVYSVWVSPRGSGLKFLVKIGNPAKHRQHFQALSEEMEGIQGDWDASSINESRVCFESYDPDILIKEISEVKPYTKTLSTEKVVEREFHDSDETFKKLLTWMSNKGKAFAQGERNNFLFRLAGACCRFGISEENCFYYFESNFISGQRDFTKRECKVVIQSAYRTNASNFGSATFDKDVLVDKTSRGEVSIDVPESIFDENIKPIDVIFADDIHEDILRLYNNGYEQVDSLGVEQIDTYYKMKRGELTLLSGIGNTGKSQIEKWMLLMHSILYGRKFAIYAPEDNPAAEFYNDYIEILLGANCVYDPAYPTAIRPTLEVYTKARDFINEHFIFIHPERSSPTPEYVRERFLELIIKKRVDGCIIDPWNQLTNNYELFGGRDDKYLEVQLAEFSRFAQRNDVLMMIIAHPKAMKKVGDDYPCPDIFDLAGGAMWNNKCHNILIYHRPTNSSDPTNPSCEFHSKKIKKQKVVGKRGSSEFIFDIRSRRFIFDGKDPIDEAIKKAGLDWALWRRVPLTPLNTTKSKSIMEGQFNSDIPF